MGGLLLGCGKIVANFTSLSQKRGWAFTQAWAFTHHFMVNICDIKNVFPLLREVHRNVTPKEQCPSSGNIVPEG